ncbi:MAG: hypothetical protein K0U38_00330 [Epsilonproteobacteria bacterium]|nr:hypothetical protein [Campylobacterota bacterium]
MKKITINFLAFLLLTGTLWAKSTPIGSNFSSLSLFNQVNSVEKFVMTPADLIKPVSFDTSCVLDFSTIIELSWI